MRPRGPQGQRRRLEDPPKGRRRHASPRRYRPRPPRWQPLTLARGGVGAAGHGDGGGAPAAAPPGARPVCLLPGPRPRGGGRGARGEVEGGPRGGQGELARHGADDARGGRLAEECARDFVGLACAVASGLRGWGPGWDERARKYKERSEVCVSTYRMHDFACCGIPCMLIRFESPKRHEPR